MVTLTINSNGDLVLTPTAELAEEAEYLLQSLNYDDALAEVLEVHLCNGWDVIDPEAIGALTEAFIITNDCSFDSDGDIVLGPLGTAWADTEYAARSTLDELLANRSVVWKKVV